MAVWVGTAAAGAPLGFGAALAGGLNVTPVALLCLGRRCWRWAGFPGRYSRLGALPAVGRIPAVGGGAERRRARVGRSTVSVRDPGPGPRDATGLGGGRPGCRWWRLP
jgi:hypothetical protein